MNMNINIPPINSDVIYSTFKFKSQLGD